MATKNFVPIKNLSRRRLRFGVGAGSGLAAALPTGTGAVAWFDLNDPLVKKDLYRNIGSYSILSDVVVAKVALAAAAANAAGGSFAWKNPINAGLFVHRAVLDITTPGLATSTIDVGSTSTALGAADVTNIFAAQATSVAGTFISNNVAKLAAAHFVSGTFKTAAGTGIVANIYLFYSLVSAI